MQSWRPVWIGPSFCFSAPLTGMVIFRKRVVGLTEAGLARFVSRTGRALRLSGQVDVLITSSREMQSLNRRFLKKDHATDVLSFPQLGTGGDHLAGELAISAEIARENARNLGHSVVEEIKILILHGMLHLSGYDHEDKNDGGKMSRKEERFRVLLKLPVGLIARTVVIEKTESRSLNSGVKSAAKNHGSTMGSQRKKANSNQREYRGGKP